MKPEEIYKIMQKFIKAKNYAEFIAKFNINPFVKTKHGFIAIYPLGLNFNLKGKA